jgi:hypothetical protein
MSKTKDWWMSMPEQDTMYLDDAYHYDRYKQNSIAL